MVGGDFSSMSRSLNFAGSGELTVFLIMGANGMGKTTTIGKLAARLREEAGQKVMVAACDTFRAGAVEQLQQWADRAEVGCFTPSEQRKTPSAVLYGALEEAQKEGYDTLIVDTSGRLSNNVALNQELLKMKRVIQKFMSTTTDEENKPISNLTVPHEILLVVDAAQGRMALDSSREWNELLKLTGLILTKLDGSAKGGSVVAVSRELGLPVKLAGVGEGIEDLRDFQADGFVDGLLGIGGKEGKEGKKLEERLVELRKARDARAKELSNKKKVPANVPMNMPNMDNLASNEAMFDDEGITPITAGPTPSSGDRAKNRRKKRKKRKGRR